jgi:hypothetical protein
MIKGIELDERLCRIEAAFWIEFKFIKQFKGQFVVMNTGRTLVSLKDLIIKEITTRLIKQTLRMAVNTLIWTLSIL